MKKTISKILGIALFAFIVTGIFFSSRIEAKNVKKITKTFTLTDSSVELIHQITIKSNTTMKIEVEILQSQGSGKVKKSDLVFGGHDLLVTKNGKAQPQSYMAPFWNEDWRKNLTKFSFKKGKKLTAKEEKIGKGKSFYVLGTS